MSESITNLPMPAGTEPQVMSDERFAEIRNRRFDEVTPGPWLVADGEGGKPVIYVEKPMGDGVSARVLLSAGGASEADVQFMASARRSVPELVTEVGRLRARVAELEAERHGTNEALSKALERLAELEALTPAPVQTCRECGAGYTFGKPCASCLFRAQMAAETKAREVDGEFYASVHHDYRPGLGRDLPELGGA